MKPLQILIVEDDALEAEVTQAQLLSNGYSICGVASSLPDALELAAQHSPDLSIVDIFLKGRRDGIAFAEQIGVGQLARHPFIFLTSAADRATFELARKTEPFSYLLKPFNEPELLYAIELAVEKFEREVPGALPVSVEAGHGLVGLLAEDFFFVKKGHVLAKLRVGEIGYVEVDGRYCKLAHGGDKYIVQKSMAQLVEQLPVRQFVRIHRNYLVNMEEVVKIDLSDHAVVLRDGQLLPYSRRYLDLLMQCFSVFK